MTQEGWKTALGTKSARQLALEKLADDFDAAERFGAATDDPEGARWIQLSDTLARKIATLLREPSGGG